MAYSVGRGSVAGFSKFDGSVDDDVTVDNEMMGIVAAVARKGVVVHHQYHRYYNQELMEPCISGLDGPINDSNSPIRVKNGGVPISLVVLLI